MLLPALALLAALARQGAPAEPPGPAPRADEAEAQDADEAEEEAPATLLDPEADDEGDEGADSGEATWIEHTVAPREPLEVIAIRYGVDPGKIRAWNGLARRARIRPGQRLRILARRAPPPRERVLHTVREGDTWAALARLHGLDPVDLRAMNGYRAGARPRPGATLEIWSDPTIHAAVAADSPPAGLAAVAPGGVSVGSPSDGRLVNGVRIPESPGHELMYPGSAWGTTHAVRSLLQALTAFRERSPYPRSLVLATMSRQRGRRIAGHLSHQSGRDLDIRLLLRGDLADDLDPIPRRIDWLAVWELVRTFEATGAVSRIFLDYGAQKRLYKAARDAGADRRELRRLLQFPRGSRARRGLVRHSPGHDRHLHVRFACAPYEVECAR